MTRIPIEELHLSVRASKVLKRMEIEFVEELAETPIEVLAQQRNIGTTTLDEIMRALVREGFSVKRVDPPPRNDEPLLAMNDAQLAETSRRSIDELRLSTRPYNALRKEGRLTIDQVGLLTTADVARIRGLGEKSAREIKSSFISWFRENIDPEAVYGPRGVQKTDGKTDADGDAKPLADLKAAAQNMAAALAPIVSLRWKKIYEIVVDDEDSIEKYLSSSSNDALRELLKAQRVRERLAAFWRAKVPSGVVDPMTLFDLFASLDLSFDSSLLVEASLENGLLMKSDNAFLVVRKDFSEYYRKTYDIQNRNARIFHYRLKGKSLQEIGTRFKLTRERVRQIAKKVLSKFPLLYEDYFSEPYRYFYLSREQFLNIFPEISEKGYDYLRVRYRRGRNKFSKEAANGYEGPWKERLDAFLDRKERTDRMVSKMREITLDLIDDARAAQDLEELKEEYLQRVDRLGRDEI